MSHKFYRLCKNVADLIVVASVVSPSDNSNSPIGSFVTFVYPNDGPKFPRLYSASVCRWELFCFRMDLSFLRWNATVIVCILMLVRMFRCRLSRPWLESMSNFLLNKLYKYRKKMLPFPFSGRDNAETTRLAYPANVFTSFVMTKGLSNNTGENNCFLNSAVQVDPKSVSIFILFLG